MEELKKAMQVAFASTFSFYLKAHSFHWNVEGQDFQEYHDLFGSIYEEVYSSVDDFAEKIRAIDGYMPASYTTLSALSSIADETTVPSKDGMLRELLVDNEAMRTILTYAYTKSEEAKEYGVSNFLAERLDRHRKHGWKLKASAK
jgi:starvation-inducible DNA-binding protein